MVPAVNRARFLIASLAIGLVTGCGGGGSLADLNSLPERSLRPGDAVFLSHNEHPAESTVDGPIPAITADVMGTNLDRADLFDWYDDALRAKGWAPDPNDLMNVRTTTEEAVEVWRRGDIVARVAILVENDPRNPPSEGHATLFELAFAATEPRPAATMPG